jgi:cell wall assembly regulator SMI1
VARKKPQKTEGASGLAPALARLDAWLKQHRKGYAAALKAGASARSLAALEKKIGTLPGPLRELLAWHDGQEEDSGAFEGSWRLLGAAEVAEYKEGLDEAAYVPFLADDRGDTLALDTASPGMPVREVRGEGKAPVVAPSLQAWLERFVADLEAGRYHEDPERGDLVRSDG